MCEVLLGQNNLRSRGAFSSLRGASFTSACVERSWYSSEKNSTAKRRSARCSGANAGGSNPRRGPCRRESSGYQEGVKTEHKGSSQRLAPLDLAPIRERLTASSLRCANVAYRIKLRSPRR